MGRYNNRRGGGSGRGNGGRFGGRNSGRNNNNNKQKKSQPPTPTKPQLKFDVQTQGKVTVATHETTQAAWCEALQRDFDYGYDIARSIRLGKRIDLSSEELLSLLKPLKK